jgi:hypothetical protein
LENLFKETSVVRLKELRLQEKFVINEAMMDAAIKKLSRDKAVGLDLLPDYFFKSRKVFQTIKSKLIGIFTDWANTGNFPVYVLTSKIFALSKSASAFPDFPKLRFLNITVSTLKLHEQVLLAAANVEEKRL